MLVSFHSCRSVAAERLKCQMAYSKSVDSDQTLPNSQVSLFVPAASQQLCTPFELNTSRETRTSVQTLPYAHSYVVSKRRLVMNEWQRLQAPSAAEQQGCTRTFQSPVLQLSATIYLERGNVGGKKEYRVFTDCKLQQSKNA